MATASRWAAALVVAWSVLGARSGAQKPDTAGLVAVPTYRLRLLGVYDEASGEPLAGVRVSDFVSGKSATSGNGGAVRLTFMPDGGGIVRLQKLGYETQMLPVAISPTDTVPLTIVMRRVTELPAVVTKDSVSVYRSAALRGFDERRKRAATGYFITEEELRKSDGRPLANVLAGFAGGVAIDRKRGNQTLLTKSPQCLDLSHTGPPDVYLDGVPLVAVPPANASTKKGGAGAAQAPFDLTQFDVSDLAGVEWYPSTDLVPMQFMHTSSRCGALLLWTREK